MSALANLRLLNPSLAALGLLLAPAASAQSLEWRRGEGAAVPIGAELAEVELSDAFVYLDEEGTAQLLELTENPVSGNEVATVAASDDSNWFVIFEYDDIGYVEDAAGEELDADAILESLVEGNELANEERSERGWGTIEIVGWEEPPHYDAVSQNLTWSLVATAGGHRTVNRQTRLLGRGGVMNVTLVCDPEELATVSALTDAMLTDFRFVEGKRYADFLPGDRVAEIGLAALITGGAAAAAVKLGLLQRFWKLIAVGGAAVVTAVGRLFGRGKAAQEPTQVA